MDQNRTSRSNRQHSSSNRRQRSSDRRYIASGEDDLLARDEVVQVEIVPSSQQQDEQWGENTTCVTGNTSERSVSYEDLHSKLLANGDARRSGSFRATGSCLTLLGTILSVVIALLAYLSPLVMVVLPRFDLVVAGNWTVTKCTPECEGLLISFSVKLVILAFGMLLLFGRRSSVNLPRVFVYRAILLGMVFLIIFAYWLFYGVRIIAGRERNYTLIVTFALSLVDALLFVHYLAVILFELRHLRPEYRVHVIRSPDGESLSFTVGALTIQRTAVTVLNRYYADFPVYNPYLEKPPTSKSGMVPRKGQNRDVGGFKVYEVDGPTSGGDLDPQALMLAASRKRETGHNDRFYEELEWERRVRKRKARLMVAAEDAFTHVRRMHEEKGPSLPMDATEAAQAMFPSISRPLQRFLRVTRQQPRHSADQVVNHLSQCLSFDLSSKSFLERFLVNRETHDAFPLNTKWSIVTDCRVNASLSHGTVFALRCIIPGPDAGVTLFVRISRLPFFTLAEDMFRAKDNRFVLKLSSETSV